MLHEILLALAGHTGNVIVEVTQLKAKATETADTIAESKSSSSSTLVAIPANNSVSEGTSRVVGFAVAEDLDFIPAPEKQLVSRICTLGFYYRRLQQFIDRHQHLDLVSLSLLPSTSHAASSFAYTEEAVGLYARALCAGLEEVLDRYRQSLLRAEQEILQDPSFPLSRLQLMLHEFFVVFPPVTSLVDSVVGSLGVNALHGGEILNALHRKSVVGIPLIQHTMQRLLFHCHRVLFNQISSWVVNGTISDPYDEFFIEKIDTSVPIRPAFVSSSGAAEVDENDPSSSATSSLYTARDNTGGVSEWNSEYKLRLSMLPTNYIGVPLAKKILFIGKAVALLQHPSLARYGYQLLPHEDAVQFARSVHQLRQAPLFDAVIVEAAMERVRQRVTTHLWRLVVESAGLFSHLRALKDFFLLGRGEFYLAFVDLVENKDMLGSPSARAERELNDGPFQGAALQVGIEEDEFWQRFALRLDQPSFSFPGFLQHHVCGYENATPQRVVLLGSARLNEAEFFAPPAAGPSSVAGAGPRAIRLSGPRPCDFGAVWFASRRLVERGFRTKFTFTLSQWKQQQLPFSPMNSRSDADARSPFARSPSSSVTGTTALSSSAVPPWLAETEGFSFTIQNERMSAMPSVVKLRSHSGAQTTEAASPFSYRAIPYSVEVFFHLHSPAVVSDHSGTVQSGEGGSYPNYVSVYAFGAAEENAAVLLGHAPAFPTREGDRDRERKRYSQEKVAERLVSLSDGGEHTIAIDYVPPSHKPGMLTVFVDDLATPVLCVELTLPKLIHLDGGRAWVGFCSLSAYGGSSYTNRLRSRVCVVREIGSWEFHESEGQFSNTWKNMRLEYKVEAPIDLVLLTDNFDRYNALFRFLFDIKRVQLQLHQTWMVQMRTRHLSREARTRLAPVFALRAQMAFLVDNLQYYLQVDVIDVQYENLVRKIADSRDFESIQRFHDEYLSVLTNLCMLHARVLSRALSRILELCMAFCRLLSASAEYIDLNEVERLAKEFNFQSTFVFTTLSQKTGSGSTLGGSALTSQVQLHLSQLILRLDFNKYLSTLTAQQGFQATVNE